MLNQHAFNRLFEFRMKAWHNYLNATDKDTREFWANMFIFFADEMNQY